jgi:hypothetical protein
MDNLKMHSYQPAPVATTSSLSASAQTGGRGYNHKTGCKCALCKLRGGRGYKHKKGCKCPLCKRRGGGDIEEDIETGTIRKEDKDKDKDMSGDFNYANGTDYDDLDAAEKGESGPFKVGGSRRRKHSKKSKKGSKGRKTRRHRRKSHRRR